MAKQRKAYGKAVKSPPLPRLGTINDAQPAELGAALGQWPRSLGRRQCFCSGCTGLLGHFHCQNCLNAFMALWTVGSQSLVVLPEASARDLVLPLLSGSGP